MGIQGRVLKWEHLNGLQDSLRPPVKGRKIFWVESHLVAFNSFSQGVDQREISETEALYSFQHVSC